MRGEGWILDAYVQRDEAVVWLRTIDGASLRLSDPYSPSLYALPKDEEAARELHRILLQHPSIRAVTFEEKYTALGSDRRETLLRITLGDTTEYRGVKRAVQELPQTRRLYNADLLHVQQYLFTQLHVPPTSRVEITYDAKNRIEAVGLVDDSEEIAPPHPSPSSPSISMSPAQPSPQTQGMTPSIRSRSAAGATGSSSEAMKPRFCRA